MTGRTLDAAAKDNLKQALLAHLSRNLTGADLDVDAEQRAALVDQDDSFSVDDLSQSDAAGDVSSILEEAANRAAQQRTELAALDMSPTEVVRPGAVVGFGGGSYVVGLVTDAVTVDGVDYEGISTDAPIYAAIEGKKAGDSFTFREAKHTLDTVC